MARRWYESQEHLKTNWSEMKQLMLRQFHKLMPFSKLLCEAALYETQKDNSKIQNRMGKMPEIQDWLTPCTVHVNKAYCKFCKVTLNARLPYLKKKTT
jgi:hypothetical protein